MSSGKAKHDAVRRSLSRFKFLVEITRRSRTRQLSFSVPKILGWRRPGKIGLCQNYIETLC